MSERKAVSPKIQFVSSLLIVPLSVGVVALCCVKIASFRAMHQAVPSLLYVRLPLFGGIALLWIWNGWKAWTRFHANDANESQSR